jgi:uncharacterized protein YoxC
VTAAWLALVALAAVNLATIWNLFLTSRTLRRVEESTDELEQAVANLEKAVAGLITGGPRP